MKILKALVVMAGVGMLAGCASIQTASVSDFNGQKLTIDKTKKDVAHVNGSNWGLYFLKWGLITGSTDTVGDVAFMKDTVRVDKVVNIVTEKSKDMGGKEAVDMQSGCSSMMIPIPFPFLFYIKEVSVSVNSVKPVK